VDLNVTGTKFYKCGILVCKSCNSHVLTYALSFLPYVQRQLIQVSQAKLEMRELSSRWWAAFQICSASHRAI